MGKLRAAIIALAGITALGSCSPAISEQPVRTSADVPMVPVRIADIRYSTGATETGEMPLLLDLFAPDAPCVRPRPTVVFVHGGGFVEGSNRSGHITRIAEALARHDIAMVSISYRLRDDAPLIAPAMEALAADLRARDRTTFHARTAAVAAAVEDTVNAMHWIEQQGAAYCLDPERIGLWGASAGAMTVLQVAYGADDFGISRPEPRVVVDYWGLLLTEGVIDAGEPPLFILHGTADTVVGYSEAEEIVRQARSAGVPLSFATVTGAGHGFGGVGFGSMEVAGQSWADLTATFVAAHLQGGDADYAIRTVQR